jgi:hypothetical protein
VQVDAVRGAIDDLARKQLCQAGGEGAAAAAGEGAVEVTAIRQVARVVEKP